MSSNSHPQIEGNWVSDCKIGIAVEAESDPLIYPVRYRVSPVGTGSDLVVSNGVYGNVIVGSSDAGISVKISSSPRIESNWMAQNKRGIGVLKDCNPVIVHNVIMNGQQGVRLDQNSQTTVLWDVVDEQTSATSYFSSSDIL